METDLSEENNQHNDGYSFLKDREAKILWGKLDYELKSGRHIQYQHPKQESHFRFIQRNFESLRQYYHDFLLLQLDQGGIDSFGYYYLDYEQGARTNVPTEKKETLEASHLLIGIFACKVYFVDLHPFESSITTFRNLMLEEYEEYKTDFLRLLAQVRDLEEQRLAEDEDIVGQAIHLAFREFEKLGWIYYTDEEHEKFIVMPSLERLRKLYMTEINNPRQMAEQSNK